MVSTWVVVQYPVEKFFTYYKCLSKSLANSQIMFFKSNFQFTMEECDYEIQSSLISHCIRVKVFCCSCVTLIFVRLCIITFAMIVKSFCSKGYRWWLDEETIKWYREICLGYTGYTSLIVVHVLKVRLHKWIQIMCATTSNILYSSINATTDMPCVFVEVVVVGSSNWCMFWPTAMGLWQTSYDPAWHCIGAIHSQAWNWMIVIYKGYYM